MRATILHYLAIGLTQTEVAKATGVTPAYVSQLLKDADFVAELDKKRAVHFDSKRKTDDNYDKLESLATEQLVNLVEKKLFVKPQELLKIAAMANSATRRVAPTIGASQEVSSVTHVTINLPLMALPNMHQTALVKTADNQVIEMGGQTLVPMSSALLIKRQQEAATKRLAAPVAELRVEDI